MPLIKSISDNVKRFFHRQEKKIGQTPTFNIDMPKPKQRETVKYRSGYTRAGKRKHPLHKWHFGTFKPMRGI